MKATLHINLFLVGEKFIKKHLWLSGTMAFVLTALVFLPAYRFGRYSAYFERLNPFIDFIGAAVFLYLFFVYLTWSTPENWSFRKNNKWIKFTFFLCGFFLLIWLFVLITRIGLDIDYSYWGGAATPVLFSTIVIAAYATFSFSFIEKKIKNKKLLFVLVPIILYLVTYILWISEPFTPSFFAPRPVAPNYEYYPYSDAHYYAITAQSLLVGEGYMNRGVVQRPIYGYLLFLFKLIAGQDYFSIINVQLLLFSVLPVLIYLLGKKFHGLYFGIFVGIIALLREITAYRTTPFIEVSHSKLFMTDFFAAIFSIWITYLLVTIIQSKDKVRIKLILMGFVAGLGLMVRFNILFLIFPILFSLLFFTHYKFKQKIIHVAIFSISCFLILFPWMMRNYVYLGEFSIENSKIRAVIDTRYEETEKTEPTKPKPDLMLIQEQTPGIDILGIINFATANFLHNEIHSILILPNTLDWVDESHLIRENEYFLETWEGNVSLGLIVSLLINLFVVSCGIVIAIKKIGVTGSIPFFIHIFYNLSNGLARVSGWRYVLVTDWVIYLYYGLALYFGVIWVGRKIKFSLTNSIVHSDDKEKQSGTPVIFGIVVLALFSLSMTLPEAAMKPIYPGIIDCEQSKQLISDEKYLNAITNLDACNDSDKIILFEKAVYPRFYQKGQGEPGRGLPWFSGKDSSHLGFSIIGPINSGVVFNTDFPPDIFPNNQRIIIVGSWNFSVQDYPYIDADLLYLLDENVLLEGTNPK